MRRLLVLDIDGTLMDPSDIVTPVVHDAITEARRRGVEVALATGRRLRSTMPVVEELGIELPLVVYNGALVWSTKEHKAKYRIPFTRETIQMIMDRSTDVGLALNLFPGPPQERIIVADERLTKPYIEEFIMSRLDQVDTVPLEHLADTPDVLTVSLFGPEEPLRALTAELALRDLCIAHDGPLGWESEVPQWVASINMPGATKATGAALLAADLGLTMQDVVAVGDGENDMPLLEAAGIGVAMGNALPHVKERADAVVRGHDEDGVAEAIERYVLWQE